MFAAEYGNTEIVNLLIQSGANVNAQDKDMWTALMFAAQSGNIEIAKLLIQSGANCSGHDNDFVTPLMLAAQDGHTEIVQILLKNGADVNAQNNVVNTAVMFACENGHPAIIEILLRNRAKINFTNEEGDTAFDLLDRCDTLSQSEKDRLKAIPVEIKAAWWAVRGDLDLFRYMAGYVPIPGSDAVTQTLTKAFFENEARKLETKSLKNEVDILRTANAKKDKELERIKEELRAGRVPVFTDIEEKSVQEAAESWQYGKDRDEEDEDTIKQFFSRDDLIKRVMKYL
jgi:hypothetical protein